MPPISISNVRSRFRIVIALLIPLGAALFTAAAASAQGASDDEGHYLARVEISPASIRIKQIFRRPGAFRGPENPSDQGAFYRFSVIYPGEVERPVFSLRYDPFQIRVPPGAIRDVSEPASIPREKVELLVKLPSSVVNGRVALNLVPAPSGENYIHSSVGPEKMIRLGETRADIRPEGEGDAFPLVAIEENGDPALLLDLVILGDGYTAREQDKFLTDARGVVDGLFSLTPYKEHRSFFNIYAVETVSNESGADRGAAGNPNVDTLLNCTYFSYGIDRLLTCNDALAARHAAASAPDVDYVFVVVNDSMYGGSGGAVTVMSTAAEAYLIGAHEFGHTLGGLADEYQDAVTPGTYPANDREPNVTFADTRETIKWNSWIDLSTPVPTPVDGSFAGYQSVVGLFRGAKFSDTEGMYPKPIYRPKFACLMRDLGYPFCSVCSEAIVDSILTDVRPGGTAGGGEIKANETLTLDAALAGPWVPGASYAWTVDGSPVEGGADQYVFAGRTFGVGDHAVTVGISEVGVLVRSPETARKAQWSYSWSVKVNEADPTTDGDEEVEDDAMAEAGDEPFSNGESGDVATNPEGDLWIDAVEGEAEAGTGGGGGGSGCRLCGFGREPSVAGQSGNFAILCLTVVFLGAFGRKRRNTLTDFGGPIRRKASTHRWP